MTSDMLNRIYSYYHTNIRSCERVLLYIHMYSSTEYCAEETELSVQLNVWYLPNQVRIERKIERKIDDRIARFDRYYCFA
jgi:hypothetical protein